MNDLLVSLRDIRSSDVTIAGGKASSLGDMICAGINVPSGFVITTQANKRYSAVGIPDDIQAEILHQFGNLGTERVSVRSSAISEDSAGSSWAGQFETVLNVTRDKLIESIYFCWKSVANAAAYAQLRQDEKTDMTLALVVQKMVNSEKSGVAFSTNPVTKDENEIMVEAIYGLGELLVQGIVTPDNYTVDKNSDKTISSSIQPKNVMLVFKDGANKEISVEPRKAARSCLEAGEIQSLVRQVVKIEKHFGKPQDIEWAFEAGQLYILQSRPITA